MARHVPRGVGWREAALGANEQRGAEVPFELGDLPPKSRLGQSQASRRRREASVAEDGKKRAKMAPIRLDHTFLYIVHGILCNFQYTTNRAETPPRIVSTHAGGSNVRPYRKHVVRRQRLQSHRRPALSRRAAAGGRWTRGAPNRRTALAASWPEAASRSDPRGRRRVDRPHDAGGAV